MSFEQPFLNAGQFRSSSLDPDQLSCARDGKKESQRFVGQRPKAISLIERFPPFDLNRVATVENIEQQHRDTEKFGRSRYSRQAVEQQIAPIAAALKALIDPDHRDEGYRYPTMGGARPGITARQLSIVDRMNIDCVEANQCPIRRDQDCEANIVRLGQLVGCPLKVVVDLHGPSRKCRSIVLVGVELFKSSMACIQRFAHRPEYRSW